MSFHEKSALGCLLAIVVVYVPYFAHVFRSPMEGLGLFWISAIGLVLLLTGFHMVNALATRSIRVSGDVPPVDELDHKIELNAAKWAGYFLAFAVVTWILVAMHWIPIVSNEATIVLPSTPGETSSSMTAIPVMTAMLSVHCLFAGFVLANVVYYCGIVTGYRRTAGA
jgi:hypothetical protein